MFFTDDADLAGLALDLRDYDNRDTFRMRYAYKMTDFQAALGRVQLRRLPRFVARRREIAAAYDSAFSSLPLRLPLGQGHVYFRYVVGYTERDRLMQHLQNEGVAARRPIHKPAHHHLGGEYPATERAHLECLSLPLYPALTDEEVEFVIESVLKFFAKS